MKQYPTVRKLVVFVFVLFCAIQANSQTFFGISSSPVNGGTQAGPTVTITPPLLMQSGDLAVVYIQYRGTGVTVTNGNAGGQTWIPGNLNTANSGSNHSLAIFWCRFNGTWSADPTFTIGTGNNAMSAVMYVYRPSNSANQWGVNVLQNNTALSSASQIVASFSTTVPNTVSMAFVGNSSTNTWALTPSAGWSMPTFPIASTGIRNLTSGTLSHSAAFNIQTNAATLNAVTLTQGSSVSTGRTYMSWYELQNDNCAGAIPVTVNSGATCTVSTAASTSGATQSLAGCAGTADDDVWFQFVATNNFHTISAVGGAAAPLLINPVIEVFNSCGGTSVICSNTTTTATETVTVYELTVGATYYYRVYSAGNGTGQGNFTTCVTTPAQQVPANVSTGKSFINITRPGGGTVVPGDELEIRVSVNVSNLGTNNIFRFRYNDTLPSNVTYVPGSLRLITNEAKIYASYTDAAGDDGAMYNSINRTIRFNLGRDTTDMPRGIVSNTGIDSTTGGYVRSNTHRPRGNGMLVIVSYRITVDAATPYNTIINYGSGALRYRNMLNAGGAIDYELAPNPLSFIIYPNYGLCSNATGANNVSPGSGDFGSGVIHNGANPGTVPGYNYVSVGTGNPGDGNYAIVKNLSPSESTDPFIPRPENPNIHRVFRVWDIIGDHTGAADPLVGNPPSPSGANGGYMLAVNAAYQLSIANNQTITGLCENSYYEFSAWFRNVCKRCGSDSLGNFASNIAVPASYIPTAPGDSSGVKPNLTFMINGVDYYTSGDMDYIGNYGQWVKKGFVFMTGPGQTSLTISIKNNAPGGGGNDWVMDDIEFRTCLPALEMRPSINPTYCQNGQVDISVAVSTFFNNFSYYQWERSTDNGVTWTAAPESPSVQTFNYVNGGGTYRDTVALPSFLATPAVDGFRYRIRTSTSLSNIGVQNCAVYNNTDVVTVAVHPTCSVLPTQVTALNAMLKNKYTVVKWKVKNELLLSTYTVERSDNAVQFKAIGVVFAKGTLTGEESYLINDPLPVTGKVYYRLKLTSNEDVVKYSDMVSVTPDQQQNFMITNLVNPFVSRLSFQLETYQNGFVDVQLADASGRLIMQRKVQVVKGVNAMVLDVPANLQNGIYMLRVKSEAGTINKTIQKQ